MHGNSFILSDETKTPQKQDRTAAEKWSSLAFSILLLRGFLSRVRESLCSKEMKQVHSSSLLGLCAGKHRGPVPYPGWQRCHVEIANTWAGWTCTATSSFSAGRLKKWFFKLLSKMLLQWPKLDSNLVPKAPCNVPKSYSGSSARHQGEN